jgi:hypothetical protein
MTDDKDKDKETRFGERLMLQDVEGIKIHPGDSDPDEPPFDLLAGLSEQEIADLEAEMQRNMRK